ncbi:alpha/beta hydrolase [Pseudomaricurvus sp.]|uniref:alpha/beta hydrolase n=1 Tax=Pseudomaricurvus sp. TaxID=2004510 RepID=UPI003F6C4A0E
MPPTLESLQQLAAHLPDFDFSLSVDQTDWLVTQPVQEYLNHYGINFAEEGLCESHHFGKFAAAGFDIAVQIWRPLKALTGNESDKDQSKGTIFLIHGFTDSVGLMQHAIRFLLQSHWHVVAFDLPGHGLSSGVQASIDSFDQYRDVLQVCLAGCQQALPRPWHGIGQSTGGAVWLNYLGAKPDQTEIDRLLLLAPLVRPKGWGSARWLFPAVKMMTDQLPRKYNTTSHDETFLEFVRHHDPLQSRITPLRWATAMEEWVQAFRGFDIQQRPLTIIQGDADTTVDFRYNLKAICQKFPNTRVVMIADGRHQLVNESGFYRDQVFAETAKWLSAGKV